MILFNLSAGMVVQIGNSHLVLGIFLEKGGSIFFPRFQKPFAVIDIRMRTHVDDQGVHRSISRSTQDRIAVG
jgi:hypothetical protein